MNVKPSSFLNRLALRPLYGEIARFIGAGVIALAADFLVLYSCTEYLGVNYLISNVLSFSTGLLLNYYLSIRWVFRYRKLNSASLEFSLFIGIAVLFLGSNELAIWFLVEVLGLHYLTAKVVATGVTCVLSFTLKKLILFSRRKQVATDG